MIHYEFKVIFGSINPYDSPVNGGVLSLSVFPNKNAPKVELSTKLHTIEHIGNKYTALLPSGVTKFPEGLFTNS